MSKRQFRILYRDFLFRVVDRDLLSPHAPGDAHQVLTQVAAILVLFSAAVSLPVFDQQDDVSAPLRLFFVWRFEHFLIATTMLAVGLLAILSWGSMFPGQRDMQVLAPLPVKAGTILLAKGAALVTALGVAVIAMHAVAGLVWPLAVSRTAPPIVMPSLTSDPAIPPVGVDHLHDVLERDLAGARTQGWLAPQAGGGLSIGISQHGTRRLLTYGAARPDSIFQIGSVTKTFTAFALARMVNDERVQLETPVGELIPAAGLPRPAGRKGRSAVTLVDLATHHSGFPLMPPGRPVWRHSPFESFDVVDLYGWLRGHGVDKPADARFVYSNLGFGLLGHALATRAGTDYASLIRQLVTEPLRLNDTVVELSPALRARVLQGYDDEGRSIGPWAFDVLAPAGAMYSTAADLLAWTEANLHPTGPLARSFALARQPRRPATGREQVGLAWMFAPETGTFSHTGAVGAYSAEVGFNPTEDLALVVLANRGSGVVAVAPLLADHIRARLSGAPAVSLDAVVVPSTGGVRSWVRTLFAYWVTMAAASVFIVGILIGVQGVAVLLLHRRDFVRVSPLLQLTACAVLVGAYLMQPIGFVFDDLVAAQAGGVLSGPPSYWFLGLFQSLIGSDVMSVLAIRAWTGVTVATGLACGAYGVSYLHTLRTIAEEPDVAVAGRVRRLSLGGCGPMRGIADFAVKTLWRSAQPRVLMAFYWGLGFAFVVAFLKTRGGQELATATDVGAWHETAVPLLFASILMMGASVVAVRSAFAMPRDLSANWIFRMLPLRNPRDYAAARRRALLAVSVVPVAVIAASVLVWMWPWWVVTGHVLALTLFGLVLVEFTDGGARNIPFATSYLPGRSQFHVRLVIVVLLIIPLMVGAATLERDALQDGTLYAALLGTLAATWAIARVRTEWLGPAPDLMPVGDAEAKDRMVTLDLGDNRFPC